jgi:hypothetical protein
VEPATAAWVADLLFPPLLTWHAWVWTSRVAIGGVYAGEPLFVVGSDPVPGMPPVHGAGNIQGARYESMDNAAAYDAPPCGFNYTTHQLTQYDVSPTALFVSDTDALIGLAARVGRADVVPTLQARLNATAAALNARLWLEPQGTYANVLFNGSWNARLNPSAFYPLLSGVVPDARAAALAQLLASPAGFCVNASHTPGAGAPVALLTGWYARGPRASTACASTACTSDVLLYGRAAFTGAEASVPAAGGGAVSGAVPLNTYVSAAAGNATAVSTAPPDGSFVLVRQEGWCWPAGAAPSPAQFRAWPLTNLTLWRLAKGGAAADWRTCGTAACAAGAAAGGYAQAGGPVCAAFDAGSVDTLPCVVPLPSSARADASFADQNYWRGRAWAPQLLLVYLALLRYDHVPALRAARADLAALGVSVMRAEWLTYGHIAENLSGVTGISQDSGDADPMYAWGGGFGLPALLEAGFGGVA